MKREVWRLFSRDRYGNEMYPGQYVMTWVRAAGCWHLVKMEPLGGDVA